MKTIIILIVLLIAPPLFGAQLNYTFTTVDIPIPGLPGRFTHPEDINDTGALIANFSSTALFAVPVTKQRVRTYNPVPFNCDRLDTAETAAWSINGTGQMGGWCSGANGNPTKLYGFVRTKAGKQTLIDFPGSDGSAVFGLNDLGAAVGQFYGPLNQPWRGAMAYRFHCFSWARGKYTQIDFPAANTYVSCHAINNKGQILGEYITVTDFNEYVSHGWFLYDNGTFFTELPRSFEYEGGPGIYMVDMNNDGMILGQRSDGSVFLYDDGIFYGVEFPPDFHFPDVRGINNKGQFVGLYHKEVGVDFYGPRYESHGFVATPAR